MQLSNGPFSFNRFEDYERKLQEKLDPVGKEDSDVNNDGKVDGSDSYLKKRRAAIGKAMKKEEVEETLEEGKDAGSPAKMKKKVDKAGKKSKAKGVGLREVDKEEEEKEEDNTVGEGGFSGDGGGAMGESFFIEDEEGNIYEGKKDACYHKVKSRYSVWPSAYASGALVKCRKKGAANWGNSSKKEEFVCELGHEYVVEMTASPKENVARRGINKMSNDKKAAAEAKLMEQEQRMAMYSRALGVMGAHYSGPGFGVGAQSLNEKESTAERKSAADRGDEEKRQKKEGKYGEAHETKEIEKMQDKKLKNEDVQITKEMVIEYLVDEGFATNEVSAEILHTHVSDEFLADIEEMMTEDILAEGAAADEQMAKLKKENPGATVKKLKPGKARKSGMFGPGARKRQGVTKVSKENPDGGYGEKLN